MIFAHRDLDKYLKRKEEGDILAIVSGRGPSEELHLGHLCLFEFIKYLQEELNAKVFIPISDDEKYVFNKVESLEKAYKYALSNALSIISLGFRENDTKLYISTISDWVYKMAVSFSRNLTYNTVKATFGFEDEVNIGEIFYAAVQAAHILGPTILYNYPVLVPIGMDQDPYMRLSRDIAGKLKIFKPASIYLRFIRGLTGEPMSASKPETSIFITDAPEAIRRKVWDAFTGGRATIEEQRKFGGEPEKCIVYEWLSIFHFTDLKNIEEHYIKCRNGEIICGECKRILTKTLIRYVEEHNKKRKENVSRLPKFFEHQINMENNINI
ncbi:MAG: tryptophan--tRNA ligase [Candidatus Methanomethylicia archaeon]|nr:tryptophan--tRNA ligase [Candidatus Methanomethylicia archaeon]